MTISYTNGNREVELTERNGKFYVSSNVFNGVDWHYGHQKEYKTFRTAKAAADKQVASISAGWTKYPTWTVTETK